MLQLEDHYLYLGPNTYFLVYPEKLVQLSNYS